MKIVFLKSGVTHGYAYFAEDIADIDPGKATELINNGIVAPLKGEKYTPLPLKYPGREFFLENGFYSLEKIESASRDENLNINKSIVNIREWHNKYLSNL